MSGWQIPRKKMEVLVVPRSKDPHVQVSRKKRGSASWQTSEGEKETFNIDLGNTGFRRIS